MTPQEFIDFVQADFDLTPAQEEQFLACDALYRDWNAKINVISRKDIDGLYDHHVLHSLAIARYLLPAGLAAHVLCLFEGDFLVMALFHTALYGVATQPAVVRLGVGSGADIHHGVALL